MACENTQNHTPAGAEFYNLQPAFCFVMRGLWGSVWNTGREELNFESPPRTKVFRKQNITMVSELLCQKAGAPRSDFLSQVCPSRMNCPGKDTIQPVNVRDSQEASNFQHWSF